MRLERLDILRGIAIVLMVAFHLNYSLVHIFSVDILNFSASFWYFIGKSAAILFILIAGFSFFLSEKKSPERITSKYLKNSIILGVIAGSISFITYNFFPDEYIRFGILHFFAVGFLSLIILRKLRYYNVLLGSIIIIYGVYFIPIIESEYWYFMGFKYQGFTSADYYPILPYLGVLLLGYSAGKYIIEYGLDGYLKIKGKMNIGEQFFIYLGKKSLLIYLIHQPIIIGILYLIGIGNKL